MSRMRALNQKAEGEKEDNENRIQSAHYGSITSSFSPFDVVARGLGFPCLEWCRL
jgi:hypothetical protein